MKNSVYVEGPKAALS